MRFQLIILVLLMLVMMSCRNAPDKIKQIVDGKPATDVLVLVDGTDSSSRFMSDYQQEIKQLVEALPGKTNLSIGWINDNTEASFQPIVEVSIPGFNFMKDSELDVQDARNAIEDSVNVSLAKSISEYRPVSASDILSSFRLAQAYLSESNNRRFLYIFSDMQQNSDPTLGTIENLTADQIEDKIGQLKESSKLPDLTDITVCVIGAYNDNNASYVSYQDFWVRVINASGAKLAYYGHAYKAIDF
ncbi:hypothetical protein EOM86_12490 [Candidatus Nomurabacteria bacterium]|nr:hypothetical protein [Candidatus Nomurabacteria bacterium]